jgi:hypothetical protein
MNNNVFPAGKDKKKKKKKEKHSIDHRNEANVIFLRKNKTKKQNKTKENKNKKTHRYVGKYSYIVLRS